jgi:hypothetical protein
MEKQQKRKLYILLYNFVVNNFFIWIYLGSQTLNLNSVDDNMWRKKMPRLAIFCYFTVLNLENSLESWFLENDL